MKTINDAVAVPEQENATTKAGSRFIDGRFRNNFAHDHHAATDALRMFWGARREFRNFAPVHFPHAHNDPAWLASNCSEPTLTWIGHATFLLQLAGVNLITDPVFSKRTSPLAMLGPERLAPLGMALRQLPPLQIALISHNHYDHLDEASVKQLAKAHPQLQFAVPLGLKTWFARRGITQVVELDWWQSAELGAVKITAVPGQHFSGRGVHDRNATLWCGFVVEVGGKRAYFAGDTGYSQDFKQIGAAFAPIDLALLPIGAYEPRWFMKAMHVNPEEAVQMLEDLGALQAAAMHWGTFRLTIEPLDEPPQRLRAALAARRIDARRFFVMQHGETRKLAL